MPPADDRLNLNLEPYPPWIAKSPGAFGETFERRAFAPLPRAMLAGRPFTAPGKEWDPRFLVANELSLDPVLNGLKKGLNNRRGTPCPNLSPTRSFRER